MTVQALGAAESGRHFGQHCWADGRSVPQE